MSKPVTPRLLKENEAMAKNGVMSVSTQKLNLIAGLIRGCRVNIALDRLVYSKKRAAQDVHKLLLSAISNAENNHSLDIDRLIVSQAWVGKSMMLKRFRARARGRGARVMKHFSQMNIIVQEDEVNQ